MSERYQPGLWWCLMLAFLRCIFHLLSTSFPRLKFSRTYPSAIKQPGYGRLCFFGSASLQDPLRSTEKVSTVHFTAHTAPPPPRWHSYPGSKQFDSTDHSKCKCRWNCLYLRVPMLLLFCLNLGYNFTVLSARDAEKNHVQKLNTVIQTVCLFHLALNVC